MGVRVRSLSEDSVDACTNIWSFAFLLILTLILLLLSVNESPQPPSYEANCWCPSQFTTSHVAYTNNVCSDAYNSFIQGKKFPTTSVGLSSDNDNSDEPGVTSSSVGIPGPAVLFLLTVALRLPWMLCRIVSRCCGCVNVGRTLESAEKGEMVDGDNRRRIYAGFIKAFNGYTKTNGKTTTYLYLTMKILVISVLIAEIVVIRYQVLPQLQATKHKSNSSETMEREVPSSSNTDSEDLKTNEEHQLKAAPIFFCNFTIKQMSYMREFTLQCILNEKQQATTTWPLSESNVFLIALANLAILLVVHVINTLLWMVSLASNSTKKQLGLKKDYPLDFLFLMQMAQSNLSIGVVSGLVEAVRCEESKGDSEEGLMTKKV